MREKTLEIAAIGNYSEGIQDYSTFLTADEAVQKMSQYNVYDIVSVFAEKDYDETLEKALEAICQKAGGMEVSDTWQKGYEEYVTAISFMYIAVYLFLGILGIICMMNMVNTMINSIHVRKKGAWYDAGNRSVRTAACKNAESGGYVLYSGNSVLLRQPGKSGRICILPLCKGKSYYGNPVFSLSHTGCSGVDYSYGTLPGDSQHSYWKVHEKGISD